jgi:hypothetical protein
MMAKKPKEQEVGNKSLTLCVDNRLNQEDDDVNVATSSDEWC